MRTLALILTILIGHTAIAQKSKCVGDFLLGKGNKDTLTGRLFLSVDSFKFIYQVEINNGKDYIYPVMIGTWDKDEHNTAIFKFNTGEKKIGYFKLSYLSDDLNLLELRIGERLFTRAPTRDQLDEHKKHRLFH